MNRRQKKKPSLITLSRSSFGSGPTVDPTEWMMTDSEAAKSLLPKQARQDLNLQPPVLETGALPIELRT